MTKKKPADIRRNEILDAAIIEANKVGYNNITRSDVARRAGVSVGMINLYFTTMTQLKRAVIRHAVKENHIPVIAQGFALKDKHVRGIDEDTRVKVINHLMG